MSDECMSNNRKRLKVLFISTWYPSSSIPGNGTFIKEHAKAVMTRNDVTVIYPCDPDLDSIYDVCISTEDGIDTVRCSVLGVISRSRNLLIDKLGETRAARCGTASQRGRRPHRRAAAALLGNLYNVVESVTILIATFLGYSKLLSMRWRPDVVHAHIYSAVFPALLLSKLLRIPLVVTDHYIYFPPRTLTRVNQFIAVWSMSRCNLIICPTFAYADALKLNKIRGTYLVIPNTVDTAIFHPSPSELDRDCSAKKRILFVGNLVPKKGIPILLEAIGEIAAARNDFLLHIIGDGPYRNEYEEICRKLGLWDSVRFHGFMVKTDVAQFMRECDFLVMPSYYEGFGVVYAEAIASGLPVVGTNVRGPDEVVGHATGLLVRPGDVGELKGAVEYMLDNHGKYLPGELHEIARTRYCHDTVGGMLDEAYRSLLASRPFRGQPPSLQQ